MHLNYNNIVQNIIGIIWKINFYKIIKNNNYNV